MACSIGRTLWAAGGHRSGNTRDKNLAVAVQQRFWSHWTPVDLRSKVYVLRGGDIGRNRNWPGAVLHDLC